MGHPSRSKAVREAVMKKARSKSKVPFDAKKRRVLVQDLEKLDYGDIVEAAIEKLQSGLHIELSEPRSQFVRAICDHEKSIREKLVACIMSMILAFIDLYKACMVGKRYANFQQEWLVNINKYFEVREDEEPESPCTDKQEQQKLWQKVTAAASESGHTLDICEQRIVLSTLSYAVYDLMVDKVKDYKVADFKASGACTSTACNDESAITLKENNINLYRYGGFALHSMIQKRTKAMQGKPRDTSLQRELTFLWHLSIPREREKELPVPILELNQGGLHMVTPELLPFLRQLVEKVASKVNDEGLKELGQQLIKTAKGELESDSELYKTFESCVSLPAYPESVYREFCMKIIHARVNEYMIASEELELERAGKAVKVEQCLRDELKTFSALKSRT